ncbi:MAG: glycoside hydrolase family 3 C-terminal domain-containing protein [Bacteroidetes bacterium]|nr:glycoside hydrolase family 3 C-terminal domain-containing protein [Bacteroidota bacterium]
MKFLTLSCLVLLGFSLTVAQPKSAAAVDAKVRSLMKSMTLEEKIGQMTQVDYEAIKNTPQDIVKFGLGSILWGGNSEIVDLSPKGWADCYDSLQGLSERTRLKVPILFGIDAVHGHNNVIGAVVFPHNIGLGAANDAALMEKVAMVTAKEMKGTGIHWAFAPCVAVARNERWGRTYESFGEEPELVRAMGTAHVKGLQGADLAAKTSALACVKHFVGDGGTTNGKDQGNTEVDLATLRSVHMPAYKDAIDAGALSVMASYNSWNGNKMHGNRYLLTDVLKGELKFQGFVVSDWNGIDQLSPNYKYAVEQSINAGMDMVMITSPRGNFNSYDVFTSTLKQLVKEKAVSMARIDDAVRRILKAKVMMGLFENRYTDRALLAEVGSASHREVARAAVRQSLVLMKNDTGILPLSKNVKRLIIAGKGADDIGMQCGGWTIDWQGKVGPVTTGGTTILQAVKQAVSSGTVVKYSADGSGADSGDVAVVVVGEQPYAEFMGDKADLSLSPEDVAVVEKLRARKAQVVVVLLSGRPMIVTPVLEKSAAFVAAWLPGTEGQGVADVLFGDHAPTGKLPHSWPRTMQQVPINVGDKEYDPLFPFGFGLTYAAAKAVK